jgi:hypothetical protein
MVVAIPAQAHATSSEPIRPAGCTRDRGPMQVQCFLSLRPANPQRVRADAAQDSSECVVDESAGYTPCNLQDAYALTSSSASLRGHLVAIVDPMDDPNAESDLGVYRSTYGLAPCTTANKCFRKLNQTGQNHNYPAPDQGAAGEIALDTEMVSALCPRCHIALIEANSYGIGDLFTGEQEAIKLGATVVSNSWGTGEFDGETSLDATLDAPGVAITFSSGDGAYRGGVQYPSASPYVVSVGGTELTPASTTRGWTETAWVTPGKPISQGSGSGCSAYEGKPAWQTDTGCANRTTADISAVAANVLSYDTYPSGGWFYSFGTSVSSPLVAAMYALKGVENELTVPAATAYTAARTTRHDIDEGRTGTCTPNYLCRAGKGYDGPTGMGTPKGLGSVGTPKAQPPTVTAMTISGRADDPTITITGTRLGRFAPPGAPESCNAGDTGDVFGSVGLSINDATRAWTAGQIGDCIGMVVRSWTATSVQLGFGNQYPNYPAAEAGDQCTFELQGMTFSQTLS